jgi:RNA polymerase sigma-70 factor (ECF subfamily)
VTSTGVPERPRPWLISTARFKAVNAMQRKASLRSASRREIEDNRLRLVFTCGHAPLPPEGQVALTLREVCGLTTEEIARAFLVTLATLAQRIVRAKAVIRDKVIPYEIPRHRN